MEEDKFFVEFCSFKVNVFFFMVALMYLLWRSVVL